MGVWYVEGSRVRTELYGEPTSVVSRTREGGAVLPSFLCVVPEAAPLAQPAPPAASRSRFRATTKRWIWFVPS
jgi:hypothetical protein